MSNFPITMSFRPECLHDSEVLQAGMPLLKMVAHTLDGGILDHMDVTVASASELNMLVRAMAAQQDGHRMWQTLDLAEHFTGDAFVGETDGRYARLEALLGLEGDYEHFIFNPEPEETARPN